MIFYPSKGPSLTIYQTKEIARFVPNLSSYLPQVNAFLKLPTAPPGKRVFANQQMAGGLRRWIRLNFNETNKQGFVKKGSFRFFFEGKGQRTFYCKALIALLMRASKAISCWYSPFSK